MHFHYSSGSVSANCSASVSLSAVLPVHLFACVCLTRLTFFWPLSSSLPVYLYSICLHVCLSRGCCVLHCLLVLISAE